MDLAARVALHDSSDEIISAAVAACRESLAVDAVFAATRHPGGIYPVTHVDGVRDRRLLQVRIRRTVGLGGIVLAEEQPVGVDDYTTDPAISSDYKPIIANDGMRGLRCVPVTGPDGVEALLYAAVRRRGAPDDVATERMQQISSFASVGLIGLAARELERDMRMLEQRQRRAPALHDSVAQMLFAIGVAARQSRSERDADVLTARLAEIEATAADARRELRETLSRLTDPPEGRAFEAVLEGEIRLFERVTGTRVWKSRRGSARELPRHCETLIIDTTREALRNTVKHGTPGHTLAHLAYQEDGVVLCIQSAIGGSKPQRHVVEREVFQPGSGLGVLRVRAEQARGRLEMSVDDDAVTLRLELPSPTLDPLARCGR